MRIFLWDIDGTLVSTTGAGVRALSRSIQSSMPATAALGGIRVDGMTDRGIARILCAAVRHHARPGIPLEQHRAEVTPEEIEAILAGYLAALEATTPEDRKTFKIYPGVVEVLDALGSERALHGLGTGNVEGGARVKLEQVGLWSRFPFGGFGSDAEDRADMLRAAHRKAERYLGVSCTPDQFVVIGDTAKDVIAAHEAGFACVGVATGRHSAQSLVEAGADLVLESLAEPNAAERVFACRKRV